MQKEGPKIFKMLGELKSTELNLDPAKKLLSEINQTDLKNKSDEELRQLSMELRQQAVSGIPPEQLLVKAFALAREASARTLKMRPFDVQMLAGIALHYGALVEMQTGEGKTLAATAPAYLNALYGKGVHVLTFNDYLARRDAGWMKPLYDFLGVSVGFIQEGMDKSVRKAAYSADITYLTAKESGFDYLRSFLAESPYELVQRPFNYAIIDEADSILIDEARIPLVIAGKTEKDRGFDPRVISGVVGSLTPEEDYSLDEYERNVFLTEKGVGVIEKTFGCGNLYDERNLELLVDVGNALHARALLKRDVDYIIRNNKIELVDEFTGRVADSRQWPYGLQEAIEAKEGIYSETKGQIIASVTLQNFIRQYPRISGMTGTARSSSEELLEFYGLSVAVIPTNKECIRVDHPDVIFANRKAKMDALVTEIAAVHKAGRPVLIGTRSVEESEELAERLAGADITCTILNAKNDEKEAGIISNAGRPGTVTVSTNMAGRGTDIRLGGENEEEHDRVAALGGLYVIGTNKHESRRIDDQLRGRAGRQGDPGSTRFFISFEDDLMKQYKLKELIPEELYSISGADPIENKIIRRETSRAQKIIEGQNFQIRRTLQKYNVLMERQRQMIFAKRYEVLFGRLPGLFRTYLPERYESLVPAVGEPALLKAEWQVLLHFISSCWTEYLDYLSYTRESIHLVNIAGKIPISEFNKIAIEGYEKLLQNISQETLAVLEKAEITRNGIDMEKEGLKAPSSTWTYLIDDSPEQLGIMPVQLALDPISVVLTTITLAFNGFRLHQKHKAEKKSIRKEN
ncbi:MAG TPA: accessory Sec system translocase SecA2 [Clostridia bacterium]|nr:accessory Sec system translocase SecA2 [Clostridia bacterium]